MTTVTYSASLVTQGKHKFYTLTMPSEVLAATCVVDTREANPTAGFQRLLDEKRAQEIADYIDDGGTIPSSIVLSAQQSAALVYRRDRRSVTFSATPGAFLILDGQHRVYGFAKTKRTSLRVPVVIYNNLTRPQEARLFIDINTKQRPVPNALLLDIKRLAETETDAESTMRDVFDLFASDPASPLLGKMSASRTKTGMISRPTFNAALRPILPKFTESDPHRIYRLLSPYVEIWRRWMRDADIEKKLSTQIVFKAIFLTFPDVAERVSYRFENDWTLSSFSEVMRPLLDRLKVANFDVTSSTDMRDKFVGLLKKDFTI